jgi:hypothetical protein
MQQQLTDAVSGLVKGEQGSSLVTWALTLALIVGVAVPGVLAFGNGIHAKLAHGLRTIMQVTTNG